MNWIIVFLLIAISGFVGFLLGIAYGQEHPNE